MTLLDCTIRMTGPEVAGVAGAQDPDERSAELAAVRAGTVGRVHSWELVTGVDGPGTRMTVFLSGCVLRCLYCHNPDTWRMRDGRLTTLDELVDRIARRAPALKVMHGGVTLSGGEPLVQRPFVTNVLRRCKELGLHTALDTSGFLGMRATDELLDAVDLVLLDVKAGLPATYKTVTGRELAPTLRFGRRLRDRGHADLDPVRAGSRADRRRGGREHRGGLRRLHRARWCSGSRCCRSTRWAATSGRPWTSPIRWSTRSRRRRSS